VRLHWLADDEATGQNITIPQYWFNKTNQHTTELTNSGIGISEVRSLPGLDITGLAASPPTFPGGRACHGRSNQLVGENVMSLFTRGEQAKCCSWG